MTAGAIELDVAVPLHGVMHFLGYPEAHQPTPRLREAIDHAVAQADRLVDARGTFVRLPAGDASRLGLERIDAEGLAVGIVTIGERLEERVAALLKEHSPTASLLLDAAGSAAAEEAADRLGAMICGAGSADARNLSCRISPGYGRWPLAAQRQLFDLLPHHEIGVSLLPSMLMVPRKSISFAMWLGAKARPEAGLSGCARCGLEHCRYRRGDAITGGAP